MTRWLNSTLLLTLGLISANAHAQSEPLQVAVAANMTAPMQALAPLFEAKTGHKLALSFGSTGKFYAQIQHGAPFEVLLAADQATPKRLAQENLAKADTAFTYALGTLVLWSADAKRITQGEEILNEPGQLRLAIADPKLAPYGKAAQETLEALNRWDLWQGHIAMGENIGQTYQFAASGNAQLGFVALSQVWENGQLREGSLWRVPTDLYTPIAQDAIVLNKGADNLSAQAFVTFLQSDEATKVLKSFGYQIPNKP
ncbi:molybdate ABC transporter substrate-binding protein [Orrella sp. 11846]|uniref:molybdate ABC transporter substrate-binding protein n=1 Tax=Orrella sp. 11846 TaxID=3409913 RepID=UPI003B5A5B2E